MKMIFLVFLPCSCSFFLLMEDPPPYTHIHIIKLKIGFLFYSYCCESGVEEKEALDKDCSCDAELLYILMHPLADK